MIRRVFHERVEEKLRRAAHERIDLVEVGLVGIVFVVVPQVVAQPRAAAGPHAGIREVNRTGGAPEIGVVMRHPAARAIQLTGGSRAGDGQVFDH
jgi:hypothetical protein